MRKIYYAIFFFTFVVAYYGCCSSKEMKSEKELLSFTIVLGSGGGFTGGYSGNAIDTEGRIYNWEGRTYINSSKRIVDTLSQNQITKLNKFFSENNLTNYHFRETGNITSFLTLSDSNDDFTFSWKEVNIPERAPDKIRELYYLINQAIENNNKEVQK
ncbi:MAG: hypothetical protein WC209_07645 [Ignavibacteriaceae bacterium]|jgi:hypothetical protein